MFSAPRKPTIFLHIGTEKTGTSTIQELFLRNRDNAAALGLYFPAMPLLAGTGAHFGLVHYVAGAGDCPPTFRGMDPRFEGGSDHFKRDFVAALSEEIAASGCPRVLMTSEHLSSSLRTQATIDRVIATLRVISDDIRVVIYLRPQYELLPSAYSTGVKGGRTTVCRTPRAHDHFFNYDRLLSLWENALGDGARERITVRLFNRREFKGGTFLADFFDVMGMPMPGWAATAKTLNPRLSAAALEFLRLVNLATETSPDNRKQERQAMDRHALVLALEHYPDDGGLVVAADMLRNTDQLFVESNKAVAARYFPQRAEPLFPPYKQPDGATDAAALTPEQSVEIALHLWQSRTDALAETRAELRRHRNVVARAGLKVPGKPHAKVAAAE